MKSMKSLAPKQAKGAIARNFLKKVRVIARMKDKGDITEEERKILLRTYERQIDVMEERVGSSAAGPVLKACEALQNEIMGPQTKEIKGTFTLETLILEATGYNHKMTFEDREKQVNILEGKCEEIADDE